MNKNKFTKSERLGALIYNLSLIAFLLFLTYLFYIDGTYVSFLKENLYNKGFYGSMAIISSILIFFPISFLYDYIMYRLFYPVSKEQNMINKLRNDIRRDYGEGKISKDVKKLKLLELRKKEIENRIKYLKNKKQ